MPYKRSEAGFARIADTSIYTRNILAQAREAFRTHCRVGVTPLSGGRVSVSVMPAEESTAEAPRIVLEFWNYCLDLVSKEKLE